MLADLVKAFAAGITAADDRAPQWRSSTTGKAYQPGIGPHPETRTVELVLAEMQAADERWRTCRFGVPYPAGPRQRCDIVFDGAVPLAVEVKMLRFLGDNGKSNDNILMHILSPYPSHRSALTDVVKLSHSGFEGERAVLIYGYDYDAWPMDPAIEAFEALAGRTGALGKRQTASFEGLMHPIHRRGRVFGWLVDAPLEDQPVTTAGPAVVGGTRG